MEVRVFAFGPLTDLMGRKELRYDANDIEDLKQKLEKHFPGLSERKFAIAVNREFITGNASLPADAEVALLPPSSGG
jgi:molybdopterin synthase sulfur carrier subunit